MPIEVNEKTMTFRLRGLGFEYRFFVSADGVLVLLHHGKPLPDSDLDGANAFSQEWSQWHYDGKQRQYDRYAEDKSLCLVPSQGKCDHRGGVVERCDGSKVDFRFHSYRVYKGKPFGGDLPHFREDGYESLELVLESGQLRLIETYSVNPDSPLLLVNRRLENLGYDIYLTRLDSANLDLPFAGTLMHFPGSWGNERNITYEPLSEGRKTLYSEEGRSSHLESPFAYLLGEGARLFSFLYSGSFHIDFDVSPFGCTRVRIGIGSGSYLLKKGQSFELPEALIGFGESLESLSVSYKREVSKNLLPNRKKQAANRILLNSWEGCYFDFHTEKVKSYIDAAKDIGAELFVLDDGWFGHRDDDSSSLGDWFVNKSKIDLGEVVSHCHSKGLLFGLWIEPEMISPDSLLFKAHPEYAIGEGDRSLIRHQLVLDLDNPEAYAYIRDSLFALFDAYDIDYVKWDHNRAIDEGSAEKKHRLVLAYYRLIKELSSRYPNILFHGCASGGGRYDLGTLSYFDEVWGSDELDPGMRLNILNGSSYLFPLSTFGAHVGKNAGWSMGDKAKIAFFGTYGFEFDPRMVDEEGKNELAEINSLFRRYHESVINQGDLYHLDVIDGYGFCSVSGDRKTAIALFASIGKLAKKYRHLRLKGLDPNRVYSLNGERRSGAYWMEIGIDLSRHIEPCSASLYVLEGQDE